MKGTDTSIIAFFQATLVWHLYGLSTNHLEEPLAAFGMSLPSGFVACTLLSAFPCNIGHSSVPILVTLILVLQYWSLTPLSQVGAPLGMGPLSLTHHPSSTWGRAPTCLDSERRSVYYGAWLLWNISLSDNFLFQHLKRLVKPTDRYYRWLDLSNRAYWKSLHKSRLPRNEHLESGGSGTNAHNTSTRAWFWKGKIFLTNE